jgi:AcrR family transcriptional regulator
MPRVAAEQREQYAEARREQILDAALRVFSEGGFSETTMDQVAADAGLSKACLYNYFPTKEALLQQLLERYTLLPELAELIDAVREQPPARGIPRLVGEVWRRLRERKELARVLVREVQSFPERSKVLTERVRLPAYRALAAYLEGWMQRGALKRRDPLATAQCLFGMLWFFLLTQELMGDKERHPLSDRDITSLVAETFLSGLAEPAAGEAER